MVSASIELGSKHDNPVFKVSQHLRHGRECFATAVTAQELGLHPHGSWNYDPQPQNSAPEIRTLFNPDEGTSRTSTQPSPIRDIDEI